MNPLSSGLVSERTTGSYAPSGVELRGVDFSSMSHSDKIARLHDILNRQIHGIAFSPYLDEQEPGHEMGESQVRERLAIIAPYTRWIRTFRCIEGNHHVPQIAREFGLKTMVGVDLTEDLDRNEEELAAGIEIAQAGNADLFVVGNENLLRRDITEQQLLDYIARAKEAIPHGLPVTFVDAYFLFEQHPAVVDACDVISVNCYPFWESCPADYSLLYMKEMYRRSVRAANGKKVIISETGWPTSGTAFGAAVPSYENALEYFINTYTWAEEDDIDIFYFAAFDEACEPGSEGDVGAYWGLWDTKGNLKYT